MSSGVVETVSADELHARLDYETLRAVVAALECQQQWLYEPHPSPLRSIIEVGVGRPLTRKEVIRADRVLGAVKAAVRETAQEMGVEDTGYYAAHGRVA